MKKFIAKKLVQIKPFQQQVQILCIQEHPLAQGLFQFAKIYR